MHILKILALITFLSIPLLAQDLPDVGKLTDIQGKTKFYIVADVANTKHILEGFKDHPNLTRALSPEDADFFIEYKELHQEQVTRLQLSLVTGEMIVYFYREKKQIVVWSGSKASALYWPSLKLTNKFLKEFAKK